LNRDNFLRDREVAIIAYAEVPNQRRSGKTPYEFCADVMALLLERTGLKPDQVDGLATMMPTAEAGNTFYSNMLTDTLGLQPRWLQLSDIGGCAPLGNVARAAAAILTGQCEVAMCLASDSTGTTGVGHRHLGGYRSELMETSGFQGPPVVFGLLSSAYDQKYGLDLTALGRLAVAQRNGAVANENALENFRKPITVDDYLNSRMIAHPVRLLDCVMRCDGGSGLIVTSTERARKMGVKHMVHPVAYAEITNFDPANGTPDITETGFSVVGPEVFAKAGLSVDDIDMFQPYDDFLIAVMLQLEQIGFCKRGEGGAYLNATDISPGGKLPVNTGGGQISAGQPGLGGGGVNLTEGVRQLFGEAGARQVPNARNALVTGIGVIPYARNWGSSTCMILEKA
jgi:acetyl-CoA acetyltransferase